MSIAHSIHKVALDISFDIPQGIPARLLICCHSNKYGDAAAADYEGERICLYDLCLSVIIRYIHN